MTTLRQRAILKQRHKPSEREHHRGDYINAAVGIVGVVVIVLLEAWPHIARLIGVAP